MTALIHQRIYESIQKYRKIVDYRNDLLFTEFLPTGYQYITLSSIDKSLLDDVIIAKVHLGMLITLIDDFADNPNYLNSALLSEIYKISFQKNNNTFPPFNTQEISILSLVEYLIQTIGNRISRFPHFQHLDQIFQYELMMIYQANFLSELMTTHENFSHISEVESLRPFNMGMMMAYMIDVAASSTFDLKELGIARHIFHLGQRFGNICNNLTTLIRELKENDVTNEIIMKGIYRHLITRENLSELTNKEILHKLDGIINELKNEKKEIINKISAIKINSFDSNQYQYGLIKLQKLHESMHEVI